MKILAANTIIYCKHWPQSVNFYRDILQLGISFQKDDWFIEFVVSGSAHLSIADAANAMQRGIDRPPAAQTVDHARRAQELKE